MLFEEAVMLANEIRAVVTWTLLEISHDGDVNYVVRARYDVTGDSYVFTRQEDWLAVRDITERGLYA